jgi:hypothetical protein
LYRQYEALKADSRYLFDKLLHNDFRLVPKALGPVDIRLLVSLMAPGRTIRSIVDLFARKGGGARYADPAQAAD